MRLIRLKNIILATVLLVFLGCSDKKETSSSNNEVSSGEIKITQNALKEQNQVTKKSNDGGQFYYSYNKQKESNQNLDESYTKLDAYRRVKNPYIKVEISLLVNKLSKNFLIHCSACHDDYANGVIGPSLLDKSGDFIYKKLIEFKSNKEKNILMYELVKQISDDNLKKIADEIAEFNKKVEKIFKKYQQKDTK